MYEYHTPFKAILTKVHPSTLQLNIFVKYRNVFPTSVMSDRKVEQLPTSNQPAGKQHPCPPCFSRRACLLFLTQPKKVHDHPIYMDRQHGCRLAVTMYTVDHGPRTRNTNDLGSRNPQITKPDARINHAQNVFRIYSRIARRGVDCLFVKARQATCKDKQYKKGKQTSKDENRIMEPWKHCVSR